MVVGQATSPPRLPSLFPLRAWVSAHFARSVGSDGSRAKPVILEAGIASDALGRDHLPLDADPRRNRSLVLERYRRRVLEGDPRRVEHGDLIVGLAPLELAADHLPDLARHVRLGDQPLAQRHVDLAVGTALADAA